MLDAERRQQTAMVTELRPALIVIENDQEKASVTVSL